MGNADLQKKIEELDQKFNNLINSLNQHANDHANDREAFKATIRILSKVSQIAEFKAQYIKEEINKIRSAETRRRVEEIFILSG